MRIFKISLSILLFFQLSFAQTTFAPKDTILSHLQSSSNLVTVELTDMDNDGDKDILTVANSASNNTGTKTVIWYENTNSGDFIPGHNLFPTMDHPKYATSGDVDGDNHMDIIAYSLSNELVWYKNDGTNHFDNYIVISPNFNTGSIYRIFVVDLNGNGRKDIVYITTTGDIWWHKNWGNGVIGTTKKEISDQSLYSYNGIDMEILDFDDDGDLDVLSTQRTFDKIVWYSNDGSGNFSPEQILASGIADLQLSSSIDFDGDGDFDIVYCSNNQPAKITVLKNDGNQNFSLFQEMTTPYNYSYYDLIRSITNEDFDGDGDLDILTIGNNYIIWIENNGGTFGQEHIITASIGVGFQCITDDLDGDGDIDILANHNGIYSYSNNGNGQFLISEKINLSPRLSEAIFKDLDNDGIQDLIFPHEITGNTKNYSWRKNLGNGQFGSIQALPVSIYRVNAVSEYHLANQIQIGDLNNDGYNDILANTLYGAVWSFNDGNGNFSNPQEISNINSTSIRFFITDFDNDGDNDIVRIYNYYSYYHKIYWNENDGAGNFGGSIELFTLEPQEFIHIYDMDNDQDKDIVIYHTNSGLIHMLENDGNQNFSASNTLSDLPNNIEHASLGDIDGDGHTDIFLALTNSNKLAWLQNDGNMNFSSPININTSVSGIYDAAAIDIDNDGDLDAFGSASNANKMFWHENDGAGNFGSQQIIGWDQDIISYDLDQDGDLDILDQSTSTISWYENLLHRGLYVDISAQGNNDGSNWANAFTDLQDALSSPGISNTIHIAEGTYLPTTSSSRDISFDLANGNRLIGGYPSGGGTRNPSVYETILSGNIDNSPSINGNSYHVIKVINIDYARIDGISIQDGNADDNSSFGRSRGAGIYVKNAKLDVLRSSLKWNNAIYGAGLFATLSPELNISYSSFTENTASNGSAIYHSNQSSLFIDHSEITNNTASNRCAIESNNSDYTRFENSIIANNPSQNTNAITFIATNRDQTADIINCTILGEANNKNLITIQIGFNDLMNLNIDNSIVAHQDINFDKNIKAYNNGILNFNHNNSYFQGASVIGNGTNTLLSDIDGDLILQSDYSVDECSPVVDAGDNSLAVGTTDFIGNNRILGTVDIGAYETIDSCPSPREIQAIETLDISIFPNPSSSQFTIQTKHQAENSYFVIYDVLSRKVFSAPMYSSLIIPAHSWSEGIYHIIFYDESGNPIDRKKIIKI